MLSNRVKTLWFATFVAVTTLPPIPPAASGAPGGADITPGDAKRAIEWIYRGRPGRALAVVDSLSRTFGDGPLFLLVEARIRREFLPIDDDRKERVERESRPLHESLDRVIAICDRRIDAGEDDPTLYLYRGWARMSKSHLHSFARSFWSAGRDAKKGRNDLERYLELVPGDPLAAGLLGAFYYFADTIPSLFKFISRLLLMPTGDREKGLRYMQQSAEGESILDLDYQLMLCAVYVLFEGRFEDGLACVERLIERYPDYDRMAVTPVLLRPFAPLPPRSGEDSARRARPVPDGLGAVDRNSRQLLRFLRAYSERFFADPGLARQRLQATIDAAPDSPDWALDYARFELARLEASRGRAEEARSLWETVAANESPVRDEATTMLSALEDAPQAFPYPDAGWISDLYHGDPARLARARDALESAAGSAPVVAFYLGEARLATGDLSLAREAFEEALAGPVAPWDEEFQMLAASRIAEIHGARGEYREAARQLERAREYYHGEYLVDWLLEGRQRYFERLAEGETSAPPTLLGTR